MIFYEYSILIELIQGQYELQEVLIKHLQIYNRKKVIQSEK